MSDQSCSTSGKCSKCGLLVYLASWGLAVAIAIVAFVFYVADVEQEQVKLYLIGAGPDQPVEVIDHEAWVADNGPDMLAQGKAVYEQHCIICHGADGGEPVLADARNFLNQPYKAGGDVYGVYLTLVNGLGNLMPAQGQLSGREKYAVAHYVREEFTKPNQPDQYIAIDEAYLADCAWPKAGEEDPAAADTSTVAEKQDRSKQIDLDAHIAATAEKVAEDKLSLTRLATVSQMVANKDLSLALSALAADESKGALVSALFERADQPQAIYQLLMQAGRNTADSHLTQLDESSLAELSAQLVANKP